MVTILMTREQIAISPSIKQTPENLRGIDDWMKVNGPVVPIDMSVKNAKALYVAAANHRDTLDKTDSQYESLGYLMNRISNAIG